MVAEWPIAASSKDAGPIGFYEFESHLFRQNCKHMDSCLSGLRARIGNAMDVIAMSPEFESLTIRQHKYSSIAQLVVRRTVNAEVPGSSPGRGATLHARLAK